MNPLSIFRTSLGLLVGSMFVISGFTIHLGTHTLAHRRAIIKSMNNYTMSKQTTIISIMGPKHKLLNLKCSVILYNTQNCTKLLVVHINNV